MKRKRRQRSRATAVKRKRRGTAKPRRKRRRSSTWVLSLLTGKWRRVKTPKRRPLGPPRRRGKRRPKFYVREAAARRRARHKKRRAHIKKRKHKPKHRRAELARLEREYGERNRPPTWYFEWLSDDGRGHSGYNSVSAGSRAEAVEKVREMTQKINERPGRQFRPDYATLTTSDLSRKWAAMFD